eukprot:3663720-Rhodomonas_salina.1
MARIGNCLEGDVERERTSSLAVPWANRKVKFFGGDLARGSPLNKLSFKKLRKPGGGTNLGDRAGRGENERATSSSVSDKSSSAACGMVSSVAETSLHVLGTFDSSDAIITLVMVQLMPTADQHFRLWNGQGRPECFVGSFHITLYYK